MNDLKWQRDDNWVGSQIEDSFVMVNIDSGKYVALNSSASAIWDALEQPRTSSEIVSDLQSRFEVDEQTCRSSVDRMLTQMSELQLAAHT
ncbi:MAG: PqqD family protein [Sphingomonadales bacterium]|nr:PqqD family protein [Sphingomonadales bacterium]